MINGINKKVSLLQVVNWNSVILPGKSGREATNGTKLVSTQTPAGRPVES